MKKIFTFLSMMPLASSVFGQAITIASTDMPIPTAAYNCVDFSSTSAANPTISTSGAWDYSAYTGTAFTNLYTAETIPFFTAAGINENYPGTKTLAPGFGYYITSELDFNTTNVKEAGTNILAQGYSLTSFTSGATDSLIIPAQQALLSVSKPIVQFPFTAGSSWSSVSRRVTNFNVTVVADFLSHTPGQHAYYIHRKDTIAGWGTLKVYYSASIPSIQYDVLVDKISQYATDSFYLAGAPAPTALLTTFNVAQDQVTDTNYRYNFYRKGSFNYLLSFYYGGDSTYTNPQGKYQNTDDITAGNVGVNEVNNVLFTTVLFPNPSNGSELNLLFTGKDVNATKYCITDITGQAVQTGTANCQQSTLHIDLGNQLANGNYLITVLDNENNKIAAEEFVVAR